MSRSLVTLEGGVVDAQFMRNRNDIATFHTILKYLQEETSGKLSDEVGREIHSFDRKERQALLLKQAKFIDNLRQELECAFMSMEDGALKAIAFREKRLRYITKLTSFLQGRESRVCNHGQKLIERAEKFAKRFVIETLDWRETPAEDVAWNHDMWVLQNQVATNIGTAVSASGRYEQIDINSYSSKIGEEILDDEFNWHMPEPTEYNDKTGRPVPHRSLWNLSLGLMKLIKVLQVVQISCSSGQICDGSDRTLTASLEAVRIVGHAMQVLDKVVLADGEDANIYISTVFKALSSLLYTPLYLSYCQKVGNGTKWDWGGGISDEMLRDRLVYWIRIMHHCRSFYVQKLGIFPIESMSYSLGSASLSEIIEDKSSVEQIFENPSGYTFATFNRNEYHDLFLVGGHNGLFSIGSTTVVHILRVINASLQSAFKGCQVEENLSAAAKDLMDIGLKFCNNTLATYIFRLSGSSGFNLNDVAYLEEVESEIFECFRMATTVLNYGVLNFDIIKILHASVKISSMRSSNFFLATGILQCLQGAMTCFIHQRNLPVSRRYEQDIQEKKRKSDMVRTAYSDLRELINLNWAQVIFHVTAIHAQSLSIQHLGLTSLRMLLRQPFLSRSNIQDLFEDGDDEDDEEEEEEEEGEEDDTDNAIGAEFKKWHHNLLTTELPVKLNETFGYPSADWTMTGMIFFCGENHMASVEIVEQVLLLVQHLAQVSFLCRITLQERDIDKILKRIVEAMPQNVYIMALVELVQETLLWTD
jgi:hypothetical protein